MTRVRGIPVNSLASALIIADKTDVRRSRKNKEIIKILISTTELTMRRSCQKFQLRASKNSVETKVIKMDLTIDTDICSVTDYFEIFLARMIMCRRAAERLGAKFELNVNGTKLT